MRDKWGSCRKLPGLDAPPVIGRYPRLLMQVPPSSSLFVSSGHLVLPQLTPLRLAPVRSVYRRLAPLRLALERFAPARSASSRLAPFRLQPLQSTSGTAPLTRFPLT